MKTRGPKGLPFPADPAARARTRRCAYCGKTGGLVPMARVVLDHFGNVYDSGYAHLSCFRKVRDDFDKADQKHNAMMLDGCETEDELNAELRWQSQ